MGAGLVEHRDMDTSEDIPVEIRARVEANALFDALRAGDYTSAAQSQERLRVLGWHILRAVAPQRRAIPRKARQLKGGAE